MKITQQEKTTLRAAFASASDNGHDFGFTEDIVKAAGRGNAQSAGALITSLSKKGLIEVHEPVITNDGGPGNVWTQFTWVVDVADIERLIA